MPTRIEILERGTPLTTALPGAQFASWHARVIAAPPPATWAALQSLRWSDLRLTLPLMAARGLGRAQDTHRRLTEPPSPMAPLEQDPPHALSSGMIGRPWTPRPVPGPAVASLAELAAFDEPGWLKYGMEVVLSPLPGGRTFLETATVCEATDEAARRRFALYWTAIRTFSGAIRRDDLAAVDRETRRA